MEHTDYYGDKKYCDQCGGYVHYLMSVESSYCVVCGRRVRLFSQEDWHEFNESLESKRPRTRRPKRDSGRESA